MSMQHAAMSVHATLGHSVVYHPAVPEERAKRGDGQQSAAGKKDRAPHQNPFRIR